MLLCPGGITHSSQFILNKLVQTEEPKSSSRFVFMQGTKEKGVLDVEHQGRLSSCLGFSATMVTSYTTETAGVSATSIVGGGSGHENSKGAAMVRS